MDWLPSLFLAIGSAKARFSSGRQARSLATGAGDFFFSLGCPSRTVEESLVFLSVG